VDLRGWLDTTVCKASLALIAVAAIAGCNNMGAEKKANGSGAGSATGSAGATVKPETGPIVIGHFASMTGAQATFGISTDRAICLAI